MKRRETDSEDVTKATVTRSLRFTSKSCAVHHVASSAMAVPVPPTVSSGIQVGEGPSDGRVLGEDVDKGVPPPIIVAVAAQSVVGDAADSIGRVAAGVVAKQEVGEEQVPSARHDGQL